MEHVKRINLNTKATGQFKRFPQQGQYRAFSVAKTRLLKKGSKGEKVKWLQTTLKHRYKFNLAIDGVFGQETHRAVLAFQKRMGLKMDGVVGKQTTYALVNGRKKAQAQKPPASRPQPANQPMQPVAEPAQSQEENDGGSMWLWTGLAALGGWFWWKANKKRKSRGLSVKHTPHF